MRGYGGLMRKVYVRIGARVRWSVMTGDAAIATGYAINMTEARRSAMERERELLPRMNRRDERAGKPALNFRQSMNGIAR